jgi:hypothetical protein
MQVVPRRFREALTIRSAFARNEYLKSTNSETVASGHAAAPVARHSSTAPSRSVAPSLRNIR